MESVICLDQGKENTERKMNQYLKDASCHQTHETHECVCQELRDWRCNILFHFSSNIADMTKYILDGNMRMGI